MPWGMFFTIIGQVLIVAIVLAILIGLAFVIYNDIKKDHPDNNDDRGD